MISGATAFFLVRASIRLVVLRRYFYILLFWFLLARLGVPFNHMLLIHLRINVRDQTLKGGLNTDICFGANL